jgi:hypothetical protein
LSNWTQQVYQIPSFAMGKKLRAGANHFVEELDPALVTVCTHD